MTADSERSIPLRPRVGEGGQKMRKTDGASKHGALQGSLLPLLPLLTAKGRHQSGDQLLSFGR